MVDYTYPGNGFSYLLGVADSYASPVNQVSASYDVGLSFNRPADTNAYLAKDIVGGPLAFINAGPNGSSIVITSIQMEIDVTAIPSGMTDFRLYLYSATPVSALADNAPWDLPSGDRTAFLGYVDLGTPVDLGSTLYIEASNINKQLRLVSNSLYGYLVTNGAYTPNSGSAYKISLHSVSV